MCIYVYIGLQKCIHITYRYIFRVNLYCLSAGGGASFMCSPPCMRAECRVLGQRVYAGRRIA